MTHQTDAKRMLDDRGYAGTLIRGGNPALLMEKAVRDRITTSYYWMEQCHALNAATLCDRAVELTYIGGTAGPQQRPSPFLCLAFKLLQITPEPDIILEYLNNPDFKYLRALAAFYVRLTFEPADVYKTLEPCLADFSKLKRRMRAGFILSHIDEFVDDLLTKDRICGTSLWKLPAREVLEDLDLLEERISPLSAEMDLDASSDEEFTQVNGRGSDDGKGGSKTTEINMEEG
ncbi:MAG: hypothetical protein M1814_000198 [Vezdaea aestivalis]|nr:MAG: hypothetical protein M1814_000198 [Vezdaea aestivalis]